MAEITLTHDGATAAVTALSLLCPRVGQWTADVTLDADAGPSGACSLSLDGRVYTGHVVRGAVYAGAWRGRIVGSAGLLADAPATALQGATLALVLRDLAGAVGITLAADTGALDAAAPRWHRHTGPASQAVADIARAAGYAWRVRPDGTLWLGSDTWATVTPASPVDVLDELPEAGRITLAGDTLDIAPGTTLALRGRDPVRVGCVEHRATADDVQTVVIAEPTPTERGGLLAAFERILGRLTRRVDYTALWPARVVAQRGDGTLDLVPDSPRVAPCQGVPYRTLRGLSVDVSAGARVLLGYEGGDPSQPYALAWELGDATVVRVNGGSRSTARDGDSTGSGTLSVLAAPVPPGTTSALTITYTPPGGPPQVLVLAGLPPGVTGSGTLTLTGTITSGTAALRLP
jgi:hypothetical protein